MQEIGYQVPETFLSHRDKISRFWLMQSLFPSHVLLPQRLIEINQKTSPASLKKYLRKNVIGVFRRHPTHKVGIRTVLADDSLGTAPYILNFPLSKIDKNISTLIRYIKQYGVRALLINHLPAKYGDNPQCHFVAKYQVAMLEPEGLLITRDPFSSRMEILPGQVSIRSMEHGVIASQLIRAEQKFGQLGPTISGNVTALPSGVLKDTIGLIYGSLPQHYEFNSAMAAMSRLGYTTFDIAGMHDGQHLTGLWFFDCQ